MPTSDLDMPLLPSAEQIRRREFATVRRGYDPQQVRNYLTSIAEQVGTLERELAQIRLESETAAAMPTASVPTPAPTEDPYDALSKRFASLLEMADQEAERILSDARTEARTAVEEARSEADRIRVDAQANAEQARATSAAELAKAREEADRVLGGLEQRRESLLGQMHEMQSRLLAVAQNLEIPDGVDEAAGAHTPAASQPTPGTEQPPSAEPTGDRAADASRPTPEPGQQPAKEPVREPIKEPAPVPVGQAATEGETVDPRYEDMWATSEPRSVDIPDLSTIDIDFDDEKKS